MILTTLKLFNEVFQWNHHFPSSRTASNSNFKKTWSWISANCSSNIYFFFHFVSDDDNIKRTDLRRMNLCEYGKANLKENWRQYNTTTCMMKMEWHVHFLLSHSLILNVDCLETEVQWRRKRDWCCATSSPIWYLIHALCAILRF